jgi:hypothetical protein
MRMLKPYDRRGKTRGPDCGLQAVEALPAGWLH